MPAALFELSNDANGVGERGGIIRQGCAELIAVHAVGPSDREKVARHHALPDTVVMWDNEGMGARAFGSSKSSRAPETGALKPNLSSVQLWSAPASQGAPPGVSEKARASAN